MFFLNLRLAYTVESCTFINGFSDRFGGAIVTNATLLNVISCLFDRCKVGTHDYAEGGGIQTNHSLNVTTCTFSGCTSHSCGGGGISFYGKPPDFLRIENTSFLFCESYGLVDFSGSPYYRTPENDPRAGGAVRLRYGGVYCQNCSFLNCKTSRDGGAIGLYNDKNVPDELIELETCTFVSNVANDQGGAVEARRMTLKCSNCSFLHNIAKKFGSAVSAKITYSVEYQRNGFVRNVVLDCAEGGGSALHHYCQVENATISLNGSVFLENEVLNECGDSVGIYFYFYFYFFFSLFVNLFSRENY
jgi:hypothetical protein